MFLSGWEANIVSYFSKLLFQSCGNNIFLGRKIYLLLSLTFDLLCFQKRLLKAYKWELIAYFCSNNKQIHWGRFSPTEGELWKTSLSYLTPQKGQTESRFTTELINKMVTNASFHYCFYMFLKVYLIINSTVIFS